MCMVRARAVTTYFLYAYAKLIGYVPIQVVRWTLEYHQFLFQCDRYLLRRLLVTLLLSQVCEGN
jgi:hypothetical protein